MAFAQKVHDRPQGGLIGGFGDVKGDLRFFALAATWVIRAPPANRLPQCPGCPWSANYCAAQFSYHAIYECHLGAFVQRTVCTSTPMLAAPLAQSSRLEPGRRVEDLGQDRSLDRLIHFLHCPDPPQLTRRTPACIQYLGRWAGILRPLRPL